MASPELQAHPDVMRGQWLPRVEVGGLELAFAPSYVRGDYACVRAAVEQNWAALEFASAELKNDLEIVMLAVAKDWRAITLASPELRRSKPVILTALAQGDDDGGPDVSHAPPVAKM